MATTPNPQSTRGSNLPQPETVTDFYLAAILVELQAIRAKLDTQQPARMAPGEVVLKEPARKKVKS